ncbi:MAG: phospho-N-acetylmuramoyl-pentapeptide-transferase [Christensenellaceae bacterium]|nr:phospho-N-acetylmuramoyl-pentapeptide-transferase [Christensenellaceae bacterium]
MQKMIFAFIASAAVAMLLSPVVIPMLRRLKYGQVERVEGPHANSAKEGTPTMGGVMFIIAIVIATLAFSYYDIALRYSIPAVITMLAFGLVGFLDDFIKVKRRRNLGLRAYQKIAAQLLLSFAVAFYAYKSEFIGSTLYDPILGKIELGWGYIPFIMFVIIAIVNSANLTDGLDGLLSGVTLIYSVAMGILFLYFSMVFTEYFVDQPMFVAQSDGMRSMSIFAFAVAGGCLGFLKSNSHPAKVFMGDTGSMALGGAMSAMVIYSRSPMLFLLMGVCIVASAVSDVLQVGSYKLRHGKRVFKMAPLHHHFELSGYHETKIVAGYMIVTTITCLVALALFL